MTLMEIAAETVEIAERGTYLAPSGRTVSIREAVETARAGTRLYPPQATPSRPAVPSVGGKVRIDVTAEKTGEGARRLIRSEGLGDVLALNFASARNPGGGFLRGAKAQEEDLARCSALYAALMTQPAYYTANRAQESLLYTEHVIYSPRVPFFRDENLQLLEDPFPVSVITAPAPNAGEVLSRDPAAGPIVRDVLRARARRVLEVASAHGHRSLVLGAWGCGVFRNDPVEVAEAFGLALDAMAGVFDRVLFAVYERSGDGPNLRAFQAKFG